MSTFVMTELDGRKIIRETLEKYQICAVKIFSTGESPEVVEAISKPPRNNHDAGNMKESREGK